MDVGYALYEYERLGPRKQPRAPNIHRCPQRQALWERKQGDRSNGRIPGIKASIERCGRQVTRLLLPSIYSNDIQTLQAFLYLRFSVLSLLSFVLLCPPDPSRLPRFLRFTSSSLAA